MARQHTISWIPDPTDWIDVTYSTKQFHDVLAGLTKYAFGEHKLDKSDIPFLEGASAAGCASADELVRAIKEHGSIRVKRGPYLEEK